MGASIRVLLVDDHAVVRAGYHRFLEQQGDIRVVAEAGSADQGYAAFCEHQPDVSVVDVSMPGAGGLDLVRRMLARNPQAAVLVFSMHEDGLFATRALEAGARGYITKASSPATLVDAVHQVMAGRTFLSPDVAQQVVMRRFGSGDGPIEALSPREFEIFRLLAEGRSAADIAASMNLSAKTVANYQSQIKDKLGVGTTAALVHLALRHGVILPPNDTPD